MLMLLWASIQVENSLQVEYFHQELFVYFLREEWFKSVWNLPAATGLDLYRFNVSVVEELPDSVVLNEPATIVEAEVVV